MSHVLPSQCLNCDHPFQDDEAKFCPNCGQQRWAKLTMTSLFRNAIGSYFATDSKFTRTIFPLLVKPGAVAKAYINGKQQRYLSPFQVYVFFSFLLMFVATSFYFNTWDKELSEVMQQNYAEKNIKSIDSLSRESADSVGMINIHIDGKDSTNQGLSIEFGEIDSLIKAGASNEEIFTFAAEDTSSSIDRYIVYAIANFVRYRGHGMVLIAVSQITLVVFLSLILTTLLLALVYLRSTYSFAEHVCVNVYYYGYAFLWLTIFILLAQLIPTAWLFFWCMLIFEIGLMTTISIVYGGSKWKRMRNWFFLNLAFWLLVVPICSFVAIGLSLFQMG